VAAVAAAASAEEHVGEGLFPARAPRRRRHRPWSGGSRGTYWGSGNGVRPKTGRAHARSSFEFGVLGIFFKFKELFSLNSHVELVFQVRSPVNFSILSEIL